MERTDSSEPVEIKLSGNLVMVEQEGGFDQDGIEIGDKRLDLAIAESFGIKTKGRCRADWGNRFCRIEHIYTHKDGSEVRGLRPDAEIGHCELTMKIWPRVGDGVEECE